MGVDPNHSILSMKILKLKLPKLISNQEPQSSLTLLPNVTGKLLAPVETLNLGLELLDLKSYIEVIS